MAVSEMTDVRHEIDSGHDEPPISYAPTAILEARHVAAWLRVSERMVDRLDVPCVYLGDRTKRYVASHVLEWLGKKKIA